MNFRFQFVEVQFLFRSNCFEGFPFAASYIRDESQEILPDLAAEVQQLSYLHLGDLLRFRHFAVLRYSVMT